MLSTKTDIDAASMKKLVSAIKKLDSSAMNGLRKDMRSGINPLAAQVKAAVPSASPFKGMREHNYGLVRWQQPTVKVSVTPSKTGRFDYVPLVTLVATGGKTKLGFDYTENAGARRRKARPMSKKYTRRGDTKERSHKVTSQGDHLIEKASKVSTYNFKAGHFAYGKFLSLRPQMIGIALISLDKTAKQFNVKLRRK